MVAQVVRRSVYRIAQRDDAGKIVWLVDFGTESDRTITNDAERVCEEINKQFPGYRILYRGTDDVWTELCHLDGSFIYFADARGQGVQT